MLCDTKFSMFGASTHNCKKCGKAVCDSCSKSQRRLSKLEKKKYRVCDECDCLLSNYNFSKMYAREIEDKKQTLDEITARIEHTQEEISERTDQLSSLKIKYTQKLQEVESKQGIRDKQISDRKA